MKSKQLILLAAVAALVGCGGGDDGAPRPGGGAPGPGGGAPGAGASASTSGYQEVDVANAGTITGTVTYTGQAKDVKVTVTKDTNVCATHGKTLDEHSLVLNGNKVTNTIVWLEGVTQGKAMEMEDTVVDNVGCMFEPRVSIGYKKGNIIAKNSDPVLHNTHLWLDGKTVANVALPGAGDVQEKRLKKAGIHKITCDAHEWMLAWMYVTDHPYVAMTNADGSFEMDDVPPGNYTVKFWHERLGEQTKQVTVQPNGTATVNLTYTGEAPAGA